MAAVGSCHVPSTSWKRWHSSQTLFWGSAIKGGRVGVYDVRFGDGLWQSYAFWRAQAASHFAYLQS